MDLAAIFVSAFSALFAGGALATSIIAIVRHPKVVWVKETDEVVEDDLFGIENDRQPHLWRIVLINRGRETATDVRTRYIHPDGTKTTWLSRASVPQGGEVTMTCGMRPIDISKMNDPLVPRTEGPAYEISWRGERDRPQPESMHFRPTQGATSLEP